ncbi:hypothetical protein LZ554_001429 [Drepanopeziza brunnea f. sp. 'monogermtubi']|nr:hypothetical protein LZ554_001429 [Drepanopeziza brunnea f. sp. 'monogermtubi']
MDRQGILSVSRSNPSQGPRSATRFERLHLPSSQDDGLRKHGWISVDVRIQELDCTYMTTLIAGSVGMEFEASGDHGEALDTVKSLSGWWAYMKAEDSKSCEKDQLNAETKAEGDQNRCGHGPNSHPRVTEENAGRYGRRGLNIKDVLFSGTRCRYRAEVAYSPLRS